MSFPGFARRLFENGGAGPLLRKEIIPETITKDDILNISQESAQSGIDKYFPQGCRMFFQQEKAPSGWAKVTTYNDCAIRLVSDALSNRTNGYTFSGCFASGRGTNAVQISMGTYDTTLSVGQLAAHGHSYHSPGTMIGYGGGRPYDGVSWGENGNENGWWTSNAGSNWGHAHGTWNNAHSHVTDMNVNYVDTILCERA